MGVFNLEEVAILDLKAKLYRFDKEGNQWKERGTGNVRLLMHNVTGNVRLVMRQAKTFKICANHHVFPTIKMHEHVGNAMSCFWHAPDFSDGELKVEMFCIRFDSVEENKEFMETVERVAELLGVRDAESAAGSLKKRSTGENKSEGESTKKADETEEEEKPEIEAKDEQASSVLAMICKFLCLPCFGFITGK